MQRQLRSLLIGKYMRLGPLFLRSPPFGHEWDVNVDVAVAVGPKEPGEPRGWQINYGQHVERLPAAGDHLVGV